MEISAWSELGGCLVEVLSFLVPAVIITVHERIRDARGVRRILSGSMARTSEIRPRVIRSGEHRL